MKALICAAAVAVLFSCSRPEAKVECRAAGPLLAHGLACSVAHSDRTTAEVCWTNRIDCANGTRGAASSCVYVDRGATVSKLVALEAFGSSLDGCDAVAMSRVDGLTFTR